MMVFIRKLSSLVFLTVVFVSFTHSFATAETPAPTIGEEIIIQNLPKGFTIGFKQGDDKRRIIEYVKDNETVENWSQLITIQMYHHLEVLPEVFLSKLEKQWGAGCENSPSATINPLIVNGYKAATTLMRCPLNKVTGKPEITLFKALKGQDSFYVFQKAFRFTPSKEQLEEAKAYLDSVVVCSKSKEHACPGL